MRIRVLSDLHLEFEDWNPPKADADVVVLAGDIHVGVKGIEWARRSFPLSPVVCVPWRPESYPCGSDKRFKHGRVLLELRFAYINSPGDAFGTCAPVSG